MRLIVFFLCVAVPAQYVGILYQKAAEQNKINAFTQKRFEDFYALPENSLDMVFIGSSHSYCTFDPEIFDKELGTSSFQMGTPLQHADTTYYLLREIYQTQTPKVVVMEAYWDVLDDDFEMKQANSFFEVLENPELKKEYIKKVFPMGEKMKYFLLPIRFQRDYFAYEANEMEKHLEETYGVHKKQKETQKGQEYYRSKGYVYCDMGMLPDEYDLTNQFKNLDGKKWSISKKQANYVRKIAQLCEEKGSKLVLVTAPVANVSMDYIKNYDKIHNHIEELSKELSVPYLDYNVINQQENLLSNENFRDDAHLNDSGVIIVDKHFISWLKEQSGFFSENVSH
ncbi:MAG: hypothetical protein GX299_05545 [Epulopiscium sp.]|nr:hypothetical protein [Candidatus Epulonipiscium sp.]